MVSLWDIIRDWFVVYIWGGITSDGVFHNGFYIGKDYTANGSAYGSANGMNTGSVLVKIGEYLGMNNAGSATGANATHFISLGDWLSTTSTIIVLVILCIVFGLMVRWLFRLTSGLIRGR